MRTKFVCVRALALGVKAEGFGRKLQISGGARRSGSDVDFFVKFVLARRLRLDVIVEGRRESSQVPGGTADRAAEKTGVSQLSGKFLRPIFFWAPQEI